MDGKEEGKVGEIAPGNLTKRGRGAGLNFALSLSLSLSLRRRPPSPSLYPILSIAGIGAGEEFAKLL